MRLRRCWRLLGLLIFSLHLAASNAMASGYQLLATYWAPIVHQKSSDSDYGSTYATTKENTFTHFNFDFDWRGNNNWENLLFYKLSPTIYYSIIDGEKFYYIGYYFYYARHLGSRPYENDFVGLMLAVEKNQGEYGRIANTLVFHKGDWDFLDKRSLIDDARMLINISAGEHNLSLHSHENRTKPSTIVYYPTGDGDGFVGLNTSVESTIKHYQLVNIEELWQHRDDILTGQSSGQLRHFKEDKNKAKEANLPWLWNRKGQKWLADPAGLFRLLTRDNRYTTNYIYNPYSNN